MVEALTLNPRKLQSGLLYCFVVDSTGGGFLKSSSLLPTVTPTTSNISLGTHPNIRISKGLATMISRTGSSCVDTVADKWPSLAQTAHKHSG